MLATKKDTCCKIPVCLEFTGATATDEFKEQVSAMLTELFASACSNATSTVTEES